MTSNSLLLTRSMSVFQSCFDKFPLNNEKKNIYKHRCGAAHGRLICFNIFISITKIDNYAHVPHIYTNNNETVLYFTHSFNVKYLQIKMSTHISVFFFASFRYRHSLFSLFVHLLRKASTPESISKVYLSRLNIFLFFRV